MRREVDRSVEDDVALAHEWDDLRAPDRQPTSRQGARTESLHLVDVAGLGVVPAQPHHDGDPRAVPSAGLRKGAVELDADRG